MAYIALADVQNALGRNEEALINLDHAKERLAHNTIARAGVFRRRASIQRDSGRLSAALRSIRSGLNLLVDGNSRDETLIVSALLATQSACLKHLGQHEKALAAAEQALAAAQLVADAEAMGDANMAIYNELIYLGRRDTRFGTSALQLYQRSGNKQREAYALNNLGFTDWHDGDVELALSRFRLAKAAAEESGDAYTDLVTSINIAEALSELGKFEEAEELVRRILPALRAAQLASFECAALRHLGQALGELGRADEAMHSAETALNLAEQTDDIEESIDALNLMATLNIKSGSFESAVAATSRAEELIRQSQSDFALPTTMRLRGIAQTGLGSIDSARVTLEAALTLAEQHSDLELRRIQELLEEISTPKLHVT